MDIAPETRYVKSGDVHIAYQVVGDGPVDLLVFGATLSNCELAWDDPTAARFFRRLAGFSRVILFDKRGLGLSDPAEPQTPLEVRLSDVRAVLDAVDSNTVVLFGMSEGGELSVMFAVSDPGRTRGLALFSTYARLLRAPDYPLGDTEEQLLKSISYAERHWGTPEFMGGVFPSLAGDEPRLRWWAQLARRSVSPGALREQFLMNIHTDVSALLPLVQAPTLVMHSTDDLVTPVRHGRWLAEHIQGARFIEYAGGDHLPFGALSETVADELEEFVTGVRAPAAPERRLATVLFTDVVNSTARAAGEGDRRWRELLDRHDRVVRHELARFRGREVKHTGDGFFAEFDGPAQAIRCGQAIVASASAESLQVRVGVHSGEVEQRGNDLGGIAVHIAQRVSAAAASQEVLVSRTVVDLVVGSGIEFADRGEHELKGVPGSWRLFAVEA
jgi:class 3 adenylate cyclase